MKLFLNHVFSFSGMPAGENMRCFYSYLAMPLP